MTSSSLQLPQNKGAKTERQKRLGTALRENLRKRKTQQQKRENSKSSQDIDPQTCNQREL